MKRKAVKPAARPAFTMPGLKVPSARTMNNVGTTKSYRGGGKVKAK